jgi:hypothetical protein
MSFSIGKEVGEFASKLIEPVSDILKEVIVDKDERYRLANKLSILMAQNTAKLLEAQASVNEQQLKHSSIFVAGARPAIMWICALGLLFNLIVYPILRIFVADVPEVDPELLYSLTFGTLGIAGWRSWEKRAGVARESLGPS